mmetsp:Transcript_68688/g.223599  ORF Transcript_68688/g.223599 Transcript_68688/m.223599 type:complete len:215 (+) Transcript_68688:2914-3558(+)
MFAEHTREKNRQSGSLPQSISIVACAYLNDHFCRALNCVEASKHGAENMCSKANEDLWLKRCGVITEFVVIWQVIAKATFKQTLLELLEVACMAYEVNEIFPCRRIDRHFVREPCLKFFLDGHATASSCFGFDAIGVDQRYVLVLIAFAPVAAATTTTTTVARTAVGVDQHHCFPECKPSMELCKIVSPHRCLQLPLHQCLHGCRSLHCVSVEQ